jgi:transmembrane sensor
LAASLAAAVVVLPHFAFGRYEVVTGPGRHQTVALDGTTQVTLNGSTRMRFDRKNPRFAALLAGEALFRIHHDPARPFTLEVGDKRVEDAGTIFNAVRDGSDVRVAVADGEIVYRNGDKNFSLAAGQALRDRGASGTIQVIPVAIASVGAWENGRLSYSGAPLSQVAADLHRSLGVRITVAPAIADRPFSGTIVLNGTDPAQIDRLKLALNVALDAGADGWTMKPLDDGGAKTVQ